MYLSVQPDGIPASLLALSHWMLWRADWHDSPTGGKWTKVPYRPDGRKASSTDAGTWSPWAVVWDAYQAGGYDGVGIGIVPPLVGLDFDHCLDDAGDITDPEIRDTLSRIDSYTEMSASGTGLHIVASASDQPFAGIKIGNREAYNHGRYFSVTGQHWPGMPAEVQPRPDEVAEYISILRPPHPAKPRRDHPPHTEEETRARLAAIDPQPGYDTWLHLCWAVADAHPPDVAVRLVEEWSPGYDGEVATKIAGGNGSYGYGTLVEISKQHGYVSPPPPVLHVSPARPHDALPYVELSPRDLPVIASCAWVALVAHNAPPQHLFYFGGQIARVTHTGDLELLSQDGLFHELARAAHWGRKKQDSDGVEYWESDFPSRDVARDMLADPAPPLPMLERIVHAPVFAPDGGLLTAPGYDPGSRTRYVARDGLALGEVPSTPTPADVAAARELLLVELLGDFPFAGQADRANAVALILAPFVRAMIVGPTPLHLIEAPTPGSGKGLLASVASKLFLGAEPALLGVSGDDAEWRKRITSVLRGAPSIVALDNLPEKHALDSADLAIALTADIWSDRLLGSNDIIRAPVRCVWLATGNNPTLSREIARRTVRIRLVPTTDRPWERPAEEFRHSDLTDWTTKHRAELLRACLVLVRAWLVAGRPPGSVTLGSFEAYGRTLGGILDCAGIPGFLANRADLYDAADTDSIAWRAFLATWWEQHHTTSVGVAALLPLAEDVEGFDLGKATTPRGMATALGVRLRTRRDTVYGDWQIIDAGIQHQAQQWRLLPAKPIRTSEGMEKGNLWEPGEPFQPYLRGGAHAYAHAHAREAESERFPQVPRFPDAVLLNGTLDEATPLPIGDAQQQRGKPVIV